MVACRHLHLKGRCIGPHANKVKYSGESMKSRISNYSSLTACRHRRCVSRVQVPRKELFVHLSSTGKQRLSNQGLKFPMGKAVGRSASEPRRSLVNELEMPTLWSEGEGRWLREQNEHPPSGSSGVAGAACGGRDTVQDGRPTAVLG